MEQKQSKDGATRKEIIQRHSDRAIPFDILVDETFPSDGFNTIRTFKVRLPVNFGDNDATYIELEIAVTYPDASIHVDGSVALIVIGRDQDKDKEDYCQPISMHFETRRFYFMKTDGTVVCAESKPANQFKFPKARVFSHKCGYEKASDRAKEFQDGFIRFQWVCKGHVLIPEVTNIVSDK